MSNRKNSKKKRKKKRKLFWKKLFRIVFVNLIIFMILLILEEFVFQNCSGFLLSHKKGLTGIMLGSDLGAWLLPKNKKKFAKQITRLRKPGRSIPEDMEMVLKRFGKFIFRSTYLYLIGIMLIIIFSSSYGAENDLLERTAAAGKEAVTIFRTYTNENPDVQLSGDNADKNTSTDVNEGMNEIGSSDEAEDHKDAEINSDLYASSSDEKALAEKLIIAQNDRSVSLHFSDEEYGNLFFSAGEYKISDWDDQTEVENKVRQKVSDIISLYKTNEFDGDEGAPEDVQERIAELALEQENMTSMYEYTEMLIERKAAYEVYPKCSLAMLIAESYNLFGLAYYCQGYSKQTAEYYFGQAVFWHLEALSFRENTSEVTRSLLLSIAQRYKDISLSCDEDSDEYEASIALAEAFEVVANSYQ